MSEEKKEPFYKSTKKVLGVIGFFCYWIVQIPAILQDPQVVVSLTYVNAGFVLGIFGIKVASGVMGNKGIEK